MLFEPDWLRTTLELVIEEKRRATEEEPHRVKSLLAEQADITGRIERLLAMVERGLVDLDEPELAVRLQTLKDNRRDIATRIARATSTKPPLPAVTPARVRKFSRELQAAIQDSDIAARRAFVRVFVERIEVGNEEIKLCGPRTALAAMFAADATAAGIAGGVRGFMKEWRPRGDSNTRPTV